MPGCRANPAARASPVTSRLTVLPFLERLGDEGQGAFRARVEREEDEARLLPLADGGDAFRQLMTRQGYDPQK